MMWAIREFVRGRCSVDGDLKTTFGGVYVGVVVYTKDPEHLGRIQVRVDEVHGIRDLETNPDDRLPWAQISSFFGGFYDGGSHTPFPVGSSVLVAFEHGDSDRPWVLGGCPKRPLPGEWEYGVPGESMGKWKPKLEDTDLPREAIADREETKYVLFKTPKGTSLVIEERDGEEAVYIIDRAGQVMEFVCPVTPARNVGNDAQRGEFSALEGGQLGYSEMVGNEASIRVIDLAQQYIRLRAKQGAETIEILNQKRGGSDVQRVILDNTQGAEEIRLIDRKGQRIVMKCGSEKHILLQSGNARIRIDGDADQIWLDAGRIDLNKPGPAGE